MANEVVKGSPAANVIAEEERLYGQVQARVAMGEEDQGPPQIGASDPDKDLPSLRDRLPDTPIVMVAGSESRRPSLAT